MKKIAAILFLSSSLIAWAQGPTVEGTYLPVRGTSVKQVWNTTYDALTIPATGADKYWDYSNQFPSIVNTFQIKTFHPDSTSMRFSQYYPTATHASFLRTPIPNDPTDSIYAYFVIDAGGLHFLGGFNIKTQYDSTAIVELPGELLVPAICDMSTTISDTSKYTFYVKNYSGYSAKIKGTKIRSMDGVGYGTLKLPYTTFTDVLLAKQEVNSVDSIFVDFANNGNYVPFGSPQISKYFFYAFIRNNTFGSSYLMYLKANATDTLIEHGYYVLPVDCGSISGTVYDSIGGAPTTLGEALLYRENSNFAKNDILDRTPVINGYYKFDSIPYGEYRVAIRADSSTYPNAFTTYYGDTTNWLDADTIMLTSNSTGKNIYLQYHPAPDPNGGEIQGHLNQDLSIRSNKPIPGIDIVVKKNPGGIAIQKIITDINGDFTLQKLPPPGTGESYDLFVDIPGLHMSGTYDIIVISGTIINGLDFTVGTDSIHPNSEFVGIKEHYKNDNLLGAYPNPYSSNTVIKVNLSERCDVLLEVYNLLGEKIKTLDNSQKMSGTHYYTFNAKSLNFPSGIYIVKLSAGDKTSVLKIIEQ